MSVKGKFVSFSRVNLNGEARESGVIGDFRNGTLRYRRFGDSTRLSPGPMSLLAVPPSRRSLEDQLRGLLRAAPGSSRRAKNRGGRAVRVPSARRGLRGARRGLRAARLVADSGLTCPQCIYYRSMWPL